MGETPSNEKKICFDECNAAKLTKMELQLDVEWREANKNAPKDNTSEFEKNKWLREKQ